MLVIILLAILLYFIAGLELYLANLRRNPFIGLLPAKTIIKKYFILWLPILLKKLLKGK